VVRHGAEPYALPVIEFTERAVEVLGAADAAARRFNPDAKIRVHSTGQGVAFALSDEREPGDRTVEHERFTLLVEDGLDGVVDAGDHDTLVLRGPA
jgi:hypothetical protein